MTRHVTDEDDPHFWLGWLAESLHRLARDVDVPRFQRNQARRSLQRFLDSPCSTQDLNDQLERKP